MADGDIPIQRPRGKKRNTQPGRPGFLADARQEREHEKIGGGHFVFRRGLKSGRIRAPEWPFEHPTREQAEAEAEKLALRYPGEAFVVVSQVAARMAPERADVS